MQFRRKKKFIDPKFQIHFSLVVINLSLLFFCLIMFVLFVSPLSGWFNPDLDSNRVMTSFFKLFLAKWPLLLLTIFIMSLFAIFFSHAIAGPNYRYKKILRSLIEKDLDIKFELRKWDYQKDLGELFKTHVNNFREMIERFKGDVDEAKSALDKKDMSKLGETLDNIKKEVDAYKL